MTTPTNTQRAAEDRWLDRLWYSKCNSLPGNDRLIAELLEACKLLLIKSLEEMEKRKAKKLMLPMIRFAESVSCGWELARYIRPDLAADYDRGMEIGKLAISRAEGRAEW